MNQEELRQDLHNLMALLRSEDACLLQGRLDALVSVFPFNEYEYLIAFLLDRGVLSFTKYESLRENYVSSNRYLDLFSLSPRVFGQMWAEKHLRELDEGFKKPDKTLDPDFDGHYDLWFDGVRIEVKAARAVHKKKQGELAGKALRWNSGDPFWLNYQQLKPGMCDVFIFLAVWVDKLVYWVMSSNEVKNNRHLSHQHRGGIEYQIGITHKNIADFDRHRVEAGDVAKKVIEKGRP
ncbi:MAG: hypothetical protein GYA33_07330 [Thermogutta sp.]|nr:hypothetical protein [Thermogutta sp.]